MARRSKDSPFGALAVLRGRLPAGHVKPAAASVKTTGADDDSTLFRSALGGVTPIADGNRAVIERTRPTPLPRPRIVEPEPQPVVRERRIDPNDADALFREAMSGVQQLADSGRAEPGRIAQQLSPRDRDANSAPVLPADAWLPEHIDDPATLFLHAVGNAAPLTDRNRVELEKPLPTPQPRMREEDEAAVLRESIEAPLSFEDRIDIGDEGAHLREGLPRRVLTDLRRGRWVVQSELDLHGLTRDGARHALGHFLHDALEAGLRCVRLIHGKGLGSPGREPVLKHLSRGWLMQREEILAFCQARPHDGGEGALLILLRNARRAPARSGQNDPL
jgi:DNA-nicking Smr family endonuclease